MFSTDEMLFNIESAFLRVDMSRRPIPNFVDEDYQADENYWWNSEPPEDVDDSDWWNLIR